MLGICAWQVSEAKRKVSRGRASDARSVAHDASNTAEVFGIAGRRIDHRKKCDSSGADAQGVREQVRWSALLGKNRVAPRQWAKMRR